MHPVKKKEIMETTIRECIDKLFKIETNNYVFIYTPPKVGSTTLVTSLRVSLSRNYNIIHIHDEVMLSVLTGINGVKINDIIAHLVSQRKYVIVIDVYRGPIERKFSEFFEKIAPYHFNNSEDNITNYSMKRITKRFNDLFPHLGIGDHTFEKYGLNESDIVPFDFQHNYTMQTLNNVRYVKLRLCDSHLWSKLLSEIFQYEIVVINDYQTANKQVGTFYKDFKKQYRIPCEYLDMIEKDKYFNFYYNETERASYLRSWRSKTSANLAVPFTEIEYKFYMRICLENQHITDLQMHHYIDNGCFCEHCSLKRRQIYFRARKGETVFEKIIHDEVVSQVRNEKIKKIADKIKHLLSHHKTNDKYTKNQFAINVQQKK
jgi:hypothetical protein